jgi:hypothetical protein
MRTKLWRFLSIPREIVAETEKRAGILRDRQVVMVSACNAISVCSVSRIDQPTILRVCKSNTAAR